SSRSTLFPYTTLFRSIIAPRVAIDNSTKVKNIILMGTVAQNVRDLVYYQAVSVPSGYATQVLDKNHTGLISIQQIAKDPFRNSRSEEHTSELQSRGHL